MVLRDARAGLLERFACDWRGLCRCTTGPSYRSATRRRALARSWRRPTASTSCCAVAERAGAVVSTPTCWPRVNSSCSSPSHRAPRRSGRFRGAVGHAHSRRRQPQRAAGRGHADGHRTVSTPVQDRIETALRDAAAGVALAHGVAAEVNYTALLPSRRTATPRRSSRSTAAAAGLQAAAPRPAFTSEDFAFLLRERPGAYLWLGQGRGTPSDGGSARCTIPATTSTTMRCPTACAGSAVAGTRAGASAPSESNEHYRPPPNRHADRSAGQGTPARPKSAPLPPERH